MKFTFGSNILLEKISHKMTEKNEICLNDPSNKVLSSYVCDAPFRETCDSNTLSH